jgi:hypothetical protein
VTQPALLLLLRAPGNFSFCKGCAAWVRGWVCDSMLEVFLHAGNRARVVRQGCVGFGQVSCQLANATSAAAFRAGAEAAAVAAAVMALLSVCCQALLKRSAEPATYAQKVDQVAPTHIAHPLPHCAELYVASPLICIEVGSTD